LDSITIRQEQRRAFLKLLLASSVLPVRAFAEQSAPPHAFESKPDGFHVYPGGSIQNALDAAARDPGRKAVFVHAAIVLRPGGG
jgi:hypothetical protein